MTTALTDSPAARSIPEMQAPSHWRSIDFISDLHLGLDTPRTFDAWVAYLHDTRADAVFMLGDLFEVWVGDDARHEGFEARCAEALSSAARKRPLFFMAGNRDFLVGAQMLDACHVQALSDPTLLSALGQRILLAHGDELCIADTRYQQFRSMVRSAAWQQNFLAQPLAARREFARDVRAQSEQRKLAQSSPEEWADVDFNLATAWMRQANATTLVHGHTHRPGTETMAPGFTRQVMTDWDLDHPPLRAEALRLSANGFARLSLAEAAQ